MSDRELLELAAKAAGHALKWGDVFSIGADEVDCTDIPYVSSGQPDESDLYWNPLEDDGDALRLAVKLHIGLDHNRAGDQQRYVVADRPGCEGCFAPVCSVEGEFNEQQRGAATRRAIVRAAAEIGRVQ